MNKKFSIVSLAVSLLAIWLNGCDNQNSVDSNSQAQTNSNQKAQFICDRFRHEQFYLIILRLF